MCSIHLVLKVHLVDNLLLNKLLLRKVRYCIKLRCYCQRFIFQILDWVINALKLVFYIRPFSQWSVVGHIHHRECVFEIFLKIRVLLLENSCCCLCLVLCIFNDLVEVWYNFFLDKLYLSVNFFLCIRKLFSTSFYCQFFHVLFQIVSKFPNYNLKPSFINSFVRIDIITLIIIWVALRFFLFFKILRFRIFIFLAWRLIHFTRLLRNRRNLRRFFIFWYRYTFRFFTRWLRLYLLCWFWFFLRFYRRFLFIC